MGPDKFTTTFQSALQLAQSTANRRDHQFVEPVHLMAALLEQKGPGVGALLDKAGANISGTRSAAARGRSIPSPTPSQPITHGSRTMKNTTRLK